MDVDSLISDLKEVEMIEIEIKGPGLTKQKTYVTKETNDRYAIYDVIKNKVNIIFETYSKENSAFLSKSELVGFLQDFLRSYNHEEDSVEIVMSGMEKNNHGSIDRYHLATFFMKLAAYDEILKQKWVE